MYKLAASLKKKFMTKNEIKKKDIEKILNENLGVEYWEFELGIGLQYG
jgi:hypothetical protein